MNEFLESIKNRDPAAKSQITILLTYPGVKAVMIHWFTHRLWNFKMYLFMVIVVKQKSFKNMIVLN